MDELDALLQLADEADGVDTDCRSAAAAAAATPASEPTTTAAAGDAEGDDDPLLGLADAMCTADQQAKHTTATAAPGQQHAATPVTSTPAAAAPKPSLCSTRAFSAATPGSSSRPAAARDRPASGPMSKQQPQEVQHYVEKLTGLKIKLPRVSGVVLRERHRSVTCVPVSKAQ